MGKTAMHEVDFTANELETLRMQAEAGDIDSQCHIACAYAFGDGVEQDRDQAIEWLRAASWQGGDVAMVCLAELLLARAHEIALTGAYPESDVMEFYHWTRISAELGNLVAADYLVQCDKAISDEELEAYKPRLWTRNKEASGNTLPSFVTFAPAFRKVCPRTAPGISA